MPLRELSASETNAPRRRCNGCRQQRLLAEYERAGPKPYATCQGCRTRINELNQSRRRPHQDLLPSITPVLANQRQEQPQEEPQEEPQEQPGEQTVRCSMCKADKPGADFRKIHSVGLFKTCRGCREGLAARRQAARTGVLTAPRAPKAPAAFRSVYSHTTAPFDGGPMTVECRFCGALHWLNEKMRQSPKAAPIFSICCREGAVQLAAVRDPPAEIRWLFTSTDPLALEGRKNIRRYNAALAFTGVNYTAADRAPGAGVYSFQIQGVLFHSHGPLLHGAEDPAYAQVWLYDPQLGNGFRMGRNPDLSLSLLHRLTDTLWDINPYIHMYRTAREQLIAAESRSTPIAVMISPQLRLVMEEGADRRRENLPTADEVAAIIPDPALGTDFGRRTFRDIILTLRRPESNSGLTIISPSHPSYLPLHYVLLFPYGDAGWHWNLKRASPTHADNALGAPPVDRSRSAGAADDLPNDLTDEVADILADNMADDPADDGAARNRVSHRDFHCHRLFTRNGRFDALHHAGRLFQQYVVDAYAVIDQERLMWMASHQDNIRADLYNGLDDVLAASDVDPANQRPPPGMAPGRRILPSSYIGGDRFMHRLYQDSMALVPVFGNPTFFITFTANPYWPEVVRELLPGQKPEDRPDLITRVFYMKKRDLLEQFFRHGVLGKAIARCWTIEYQKRGLPHVHFLLWVENSREFLDPAKVDKVICAELPTPDWDKDGKLASLISSTMVHGPCGDHNPDAPCMVYNNKTGRKACSKGFPKALRDETHVPENGSYPLYRRREATGAEFMVKIKGREVQVDNQWVVPYNPYLSQRYNAHINVEMSNGVSAIKYIHKYIFKGDARVAAEVTTAPDEVSQHLYGRYIGPVEAIYRLLGFRTHEEFPHIVPLALHLPGQHAVYFAADATPEQLRAQMEKSGSTLLAYFAYNAAAPPTERRCLYVDMPRFFTWNKPNKRWVVRKQRFAIGRIYTAAPTEGERYFLRLLLLNVGGSPSYEALRTVDGQVYPTFRGACAVLGLLEDDRHWVLTFTEASVFQTGRALRLLFVLALIFGPVSDPMALWEQFKTSICDDLPRFLARNQVILPNWADPHLDYGLYLTNDLLHAHGRVLADFGMPMPRHDWGAAADVIPWQVELADDLMEETDVAIELRRQLNDDQSAAFDQIIAAIETEPTTAHFFVQGPGGTGKTFLYKAIYHHLRSKGKLVLCVASSGIAALLLPRGRTAHSRFKIPLTCDEGSTCNVTRTSQLGRLLQQVHLVIWDEVPMQNRSNFEAVHRTLCDLKASEALFGGVPILMGGDFAQTLPVVVSGSRARTVGASLQKSFIWQRLTILRLSRNMRLPAGGCNADYAEWLRQMSYDPRLIGPVALPAYVRCVYELIDLIESVFPLASLRSPALRDDLLANCAVLSVYNASLKEINDLMLDRLPGDAVTFFAADKTDLLEELPAEYMKTVHPPGMPPAVLQLKVGAPVMLLRNLRPEDGLCNGTRLIVTRLSRHVIEARILAGEFRGRVHLIPRILLVTRKEQLNYELQRKQFPIQLCFAITINKSQGQSLQAVGIDLRVPAFAHGQLYVALSRVTDVSRLTVLYGSKDVETTRNVVYSEVLNQFRA